jgi:hypothetical protein
VGHADRETVAAQDRLSQGRKAPVGSPSKETSKDTINLGRVIQSRRQPPVLPSWIPADHILHLDSSILKRIRQEFDSQSIFLNIPYSKRYSRLEIAIISTVTAYGLTPRMARERSKLEVRLTKIVELMLVCRYGLTDLTYVKRMNMPFELGLLLAFGKENFITSSRPYSALRSISDFNFADIHYHGGTVRRLITGLSRWIEQASSTKRITIRTLFQRYRRLQTIHTQLGADFEKLKPQEIAKLLPVVEDEFNMKLYGR